MTTSLSSSLSSLGFIGACEQLARNWPHLISRGSGCLRLSPCAGCIKYVEHVMFYNSWPCLEWSSHNYTVFYGLTESREFVNRSIKLEDSKVALVSSSASNIRSAWVSQIKFIAFGVANEISHFTVSRDNNESPYEICLFQLFRIWATDVMTEEFRAVNFHESLCPATYATTFCLEFLTICLREVQNGFLHGHDLRL